MNDPHNATGRSAVFGESALPRLFHLTDRAAVRRQQATLDWVRRQLVLLVAAAAFPAVPWQWRIGHVDLLALASAAAYLAALWLAWEAARHHYKGSWQLQRSAAELLRSHCWRYAVCGAPYGREVAEPDALFAVRVGESLHQLQVIGWRDPRGPDAPGPDRELITPAMRAMRAGHFATRREVYARDRVLEQRDWYHRRSAQSRRAAAVWRALAAFGTTAAMVAAAAKAFEWGSSVDLVGLASSAAASSVAWSELRQYQPLVAAHALVAQELATMVPTTEHTAEPRWAQTVEATEATISPDHTAWLTRHHS